MQTRAGSPFARTTCAAAKTAGASAHERGRSPAPRMKKLNICACGAWERARGQAKYCKYHTHGVPVLKQSACLTRTDPSGCQAAARAACAVKPQREIRGGLTSDLRVPLAACSTRALAGVWHPSKLRRRRRRAALSARVRPSQRARASCPSYVCVHTRLLQPRWLPPLDTDPTRTRAHHASPYP